MPIRLKKNNWFKQLQSGYVCTEKSVMIAQTGKQIKVKGVQTAYWDDGNKETGKV